MLAASGCGDDGDQLKAPDTLRPIARVATQNAGTTEFMLLADPQQTPRRADCSQWYENNLCTTDAEAVLRERIEATQPDILLLQEMWHDIWCEPPERPERINNEPYVCAFNGNQIERILPRGYAYGCAERHLDNCIVFRTDVFVPDAGFDACDGRDCSALIDDLANECTNPGHTALLPGRSADGPLVLGVVHVNAGLQQSDQRCRAAELAPMAERLAALPATVAIIAGGDFNFDIADPNVASDERPPDRTDRRGANSDQSPSEHPDGLPADARMGRRRRRLHAHICRRFVADQNVRPRVC